MPEDNQTQNENQNNGSEQNQDQNADSNNNNNQEEEEESKEDEVVFHPHKGKIMQIKPYTLMTSVSYDKSYDSPTGNGSVELKLSDDDLKYVYSGVSCKLKIRRDTDRQFSDTGIEEVYDEENIKIREHYPTIEQLVEYDTFIEDKEFISNEYKDYDVASTMVCRSASDDGLYGFVTEVEHTQNNSKLKLKDWGLCLEDTEKELNFEGLFRSEVIEEVAKSYGLVPIVDLTGLDDDIISWSNKKVMSSGKGSANDDAEQSDTFGHCSSPLDLSANAKVSSEGDIPSDITEDMYAKIGKEDSNYGEWAKGKTPQQVMEGLRSGFKWQNYEVTKQGSCATDTFVEGKIRANCGDSARLVKCCMDVIGVKCIVIHCPGHFYNAIEVDGTWYTCDLTNRRYCKNRIKTNTFGY